MHATHAQASGMGGIRTTGDLVGRLQLNKGMRLNDAKRFVAAKLGVSVADIHDEIAMTELRKELDIGNVYMGYDTPARGIEAKFRIAELLDLEINCVNRFQDKVRFK